LQVAGSDEKGPLDSPKIDANAVRPLEGILPSGGRAKRGAGGSLYLQPAIAGLNSGSRRVPCAKRRWVPVLRIGTRATRGR
jgi:hypothetical protein